MRVWVLLLSLSMVILGAVPALAEDGPRWSLATSVNYTVGDYGTGKDTTILYVPFTLGVRPLDRLWIRATVPFIRQDTQNVVSTSGGAAARNQEKGKLARPATATTEEGLGDMLLNLSYRILEEQALIPEIEPYVKIKFPTADVDRGLGTGEFDETLGVDFSKQLIGSLFGYLTLAYTFIGSPPGSDLHDSFGWSVGATYGVIPPVSVFAFLDGSTAVAPGQDDPLALRVGAELKITRILTLTGAVSRGLSDGAEDWGGSAALTLRF